MKKANLSTKTILVPGILAGMFLGFTTTLFVYALVAIGNVPVAALFFPVGFILLVLLGLELFTGNAALLPYSAMAGKVSSGKLVKALITVYVGNLIGSVLHALIFAAIDTKMFTDAPDPIGALAGLKTTAYMNLGAVMALVTHSTIGKIFAMYLPIMAFVAQGFEHYVVNMFVIPCGIMLGANISIAQWWIWNELPVTLGNLAGTVIFTAGGLYVAFGNTAKAEPVSMAVAAE
jgi:formate transporter